LGKIDQQCGRLVQLIERLLDVSRIQLGRLHLDPKPVGLMTLLRRVAEEHQAAIPDHPIVTLLPEGEVIGRWDEMRLQQVLSNLLSNAAKYGPEDSPIELSAHVDTEHTVISVRDQGVGIDPDKLPHVFDRFYRTPKASQSQVEGLGLGLFVAREIVLAHGGAIWAESAPGQGSTFYVRLPIHPGDHSQSSS